MLWRLPAITSGLGSGRLCVRGEVLAPLLPGAAGSYKSIPAEWGRRLFTNTGRVANSQAVEQERRSIKKTEAHGSERVDVARHRADALAVLQRGRRFYQ